MNSSGLFPAGRADAERRSVFSYPRRVFFPSPLLILYSIRDVKRGRAVG